MKFICHRTQSNLDPQTTIQLCRSRHSCHFRKHRYGNNISIET